MYSDSSTSRHAAESSSSVNNHTKSKPYSMNEIVEIDSAGHPIDGNIDRFIKHPAVDSHTHIKDSGQRREFESGAVRDIVEGKGRCDLVPLSSASILIFSSYSPVPDIDFIKRNIEKIVLQALDEYIVRFNEGIEVQEHQLSKVVQNFLFARSWTKQDAFLEVSEHYEEGAKKYGEYNWQKGIPCHSYIDSAIRHLMKWSRGDTDEPHDRAFLWNILSLHWTTLNHPELVDFINK